MTSKSASGRVSEAAHDLPVHPLTLWFSRGREELEDIYREQLLTRYLGHFRLCHWIAILYYAVYILLDFYLAPENIAVFLTIRFGIVIPLFLIGIGLSYFAWYGRIVNFMLAFYVVLTAAGFTVMAGYVQVEIHFIYALGVVACLIFGYTFIRLPLLYATVAGFLALGVYWMAQVFSARLAGSTFIAYFSYLVGFNVLLLIICYSMEKSERRNFYLSHLLGLERDKTSRINADLEETVTRRTAELRVANEKLTKEINEHIAAQKANEQLQRQLRHSQKMEAIGTLAGGIAHDFNNILGSVIGFTELAIDDAEPDTLLMSNLQEILIAGKRARDLVKQILTFSRRDDQTMQVVELVEVLKEVQHLLRASISASIVLEVQVHHSARVFADPSQINQILMNLCINAAQAIGPDGGKITLSLDQTVLENSFCQRFPGTKTGPHAILVVKDTGHGMPAELMDRIFDPFFTTKPQGQGTGLGLAVVHGIVQNHGGAITVESEPGKGASFRIYLPVVHAEPQAETVVASRLPVGRERVLYIDDESALLRFGQLALSRLGYTVTVQENPMEALVLFKHRPHDFDLVITDLAMPGMQGDVLVAEIRRLRPDMPIILCSGLKAAISDQRISDLGITAVIHKPVLKSDLAHAIRRAFDKAYP